MADVTLEFIAERLERIQTELAAMRADIAAIRADVATLREDVTVLGTLYLRLERNDLQIKEALARVENRVAKLETA